MMSLERLYYSLGAPRWFWPVVLGALLLIFMCAGALIENE